MLASSKQESPPPADWTLFLRKWKCRVDIDADLSVRPLATTTPAIRCPLTPKCPWRIDSRRSWPAPLRPLVNWSEAPVPIMWKATSPISRVHPPLVGTWRPRPTRQIPTVRSRGRRHGLRINRWENTTFSPSEHGRIRFTSTCIIGPKSLRLRDDRATSPPTHLRWWARTTDRIPILPAEKVTADIRTWQESTASIWLMSIDRRKVDVVGIPKRPVSLGTAIITVNPDWDTLEVIDRGAPPTVPDHPGPIDSVVQHLNTGPDVHFQSTDLLHLYYSAVYPVSILRFTYCELPCLCMIYIIKLNVAYTLKQSCNIYI